MKEDAQREIQQRLQD